MKDNTDKILDKSVLNKFAPDKFAPDKLLLRNDVETLDVRSVFRSTPESKTLTQTNRIANTMRLV